MRHREVFKNRFLRKRILSTLFILLGYSPLAPLISKLVGLHLSLTVITIFAIAESLTGMVQILFKRWSMSRLLGVTLGLDVLTVTSIVLYGSGLVSAPIFVVICTCTFLTTSILGGALTANISDYTSKICSDLYKDFLYTIGFIKSFASTGILIITLVFSFSYQETSNLVLSAILILVSIKFQYDLYQELRCCKEV